MGTHVWTVLPKTYYLPHCSPIEHDKTTNYKTYTGCDENNVDIDCLSFFKNALVRFDHVKARCCSLHLIGDVSITAHVWQLQDGLQLSVTVSLESQFLIGIYFHNPRG